MEGGVVAYQFAFVAFMAAYSILAQPVHTTILPEMSLDANRGDDAAFAGRIRWALDRMGTLVLPVSAAFLALSLPAMKVIAPGSSNPELLAAALASLGAGLFFYSGFLLLARGFYARGDSRTPAVVALGSAVIGSVVMIVGVNSVDGGPARVAMLGIGHSVAYLLGAAVLFVVLRGAGRPTVVPTLHLACAPDLGGARRGGLGSDARDRPRRAPRHRGRARGDRPARCRPLRRDVAHAAEGSGAARSRARADRSRSRRRVVRSLRAAAVAGMIAGMIGSALLAGTATSAPAAHAAPAPTPPVDRVLVVSLPAASWADVESADAPHLKALLSRSAVADLVTRAAGRRNSAASGYATLGAGGRASAVNPLAGQAFEPSEPYGDTTAGEVFRQRTGLTVDSGLVHLGHRRARPGERRRCVRPDPGQRSVTP